MKASIKVDKNTAVRAGLNNVGVYTIEFNPADLTEEQRNEMARSSETDNGEYCVNYDRYKEKLNKELTKIAAPTYENMIMLLDERIIIRAEKLQIEQERKEKERDNQIRSIKGWMAEPIEKAINEPHWDRRSYTISFPNAIYGHPADKMETLLSFCNEIDGLQDRIDDLESLVFWLKTDRKAGDIIKAREKQEREEREEREAEEREARRKDQLATWVREHGTENQKGRFAIDMLPENEIIDGIREQAFAPLNNFETYQRMKRSDVCSCDYDYCGVEFETVVADDLTADEYDIMMEIKDLLPNSYVVVKQHIGTSYDCEEKVKRTGYHVTLKVGELKLTRELSGEKNND